MRSIRLWSPSHPLHLLHPTHILHPTQNLLNYFLIHTSMHNQHRIPGPVPVQLHLFNDHFLFFKKQSQPSYRFHRGINMQYKGARLLYHFSPQFHFSLSAYPDHRKNSFHISLVIRPALIPTLFSAVLESAGPCLTTRSSPLHAHRTFSMPGNYAAPGHANCKTPFPCHTAEP